MAYFALIRLKILPSTLLSLSENERAFVYACMQVCSEREKRERDKINAR